MMQCDYKALIDYSQELNLKMNQIKSSMDIIEECFKKIVNTSNWNSQTRNYFYDVYNKMAANYDNLANKFNNINMYLDQVINNYIAFEQAMSQAFGG